MTFSAKGNLLKTINETNDPAMRTVLLLMLGVFEEVVEKIDAVLNNEQAIKAIVLNGHTDVHHKHHELLNALLSSGDDVAQAVAWAASKQREEQVANERLEDTRRKVTQALIVESAKWLVVGGGGLLLGQYLSLHFFK